MLCCFNSETTDKSVSQGFIKLVTMEVTVCTQTLLLSHKFSIGFACSLISPLEVESLSNNCLLRRKVVIQCLL